MSKSIRKREIGDLSGNTLSVEARGMSKLKGSHSKHDRLKSKGRAKSHGKNEVVYWGCGEKGHFKDRLKLKRRKAKKKFHEDDDSVYSANDIALILSMDSPVNSWIFDSDASFHSSLSRQSFHNFKSENYRKVYFIDNKVLEIAGKGMCVFRSQVRVSGSCRMSNIILT